MKLMVINKFYEILTKRPQRFFKKDFYLRLFRIIRSSLVVGNQPAANRPRIYFDLSVFSIFDNRTGVQRVIRSVYSELKLLVGSEYELVPVAATAFTKGFQVLKEENTTKSTNFKLTGVNIVAREGDVFFSLEQAFLEHLAHISEFETMKQCGCKVILTVYDLLPIQLPECFPPEVEGIFKLWLKETSKVAEYICDSKTVKIDLDNYLAQNNLNKPNSSWFYPGCDFIKSISTRGLTSEQKSFLADSCKFKFNFLMVGTVEPRKGHRLVYSLFESLWQNGHENISLTFVGKEGWMVDDLTSSFLRSKFYKKNFFWFNKASDEFLNNCYNSADAVIIASLNEGFGLPILEAAYHERRIIANDIPIFREVAPENCFFINLKKPEVALRQLQLWLEKPSEKCYLSSPPSWHSATKLILNRIKGEQVIKTVLY